MSKLLAEWFWIERWEGSSAAMLPMEAQGVYRAMLSHAWRRGASLPVEPEEIQLLIRCRAKEWKRSWPKVRPYWKEDGGVLVNETQREVYAEALAKKERAQARAQAAAQARHGKMPKNLPEQCPPSPSPTINPIQPPSSPSVDSRSADDARADLMAALSTLQASAEFRGMEAQAILNLPRFCAASGPVRLAGNPPDGLMRATAGKLRAYGRPVPAKLNGVPSWDRGIEHDVSEAELTAWDPRLGPRHAAEPNSGSAA